MSTPPIQRYDMYLDGAGVRVGKSKEGEYVTHEDHMRAVQAARAEKAEAAQAWQPIETAPRTNRARLVYCPDRKNTYLVTWLETVDTFDSAEGHWLHFNSGRPLREEPSHWMPLPPNPTKDTQ